MEKSPDSTGALKYLLMESEIYASSSVYKILVSLMAGLEELDKQTSAEFEENVLLARLDGKVSDKTFDGLSNYCSREIKKITTARRALAGDVRKVIGLNSLPK